MRKTGYRNCLAAAAGASTFVTAGCGLAALSGAAADNGSASPARLTEHVPAVALVMVAGPMVTGANLARTVIATAQPSEYLDILTPGTPPDAVVSAQAPGPVTVAAPGRPAAPGPDASSYQSAVYRKQVERWNAEVAAGRRAVTARTAAATAAWSHGLRIPRTIRGGDVDLAGETAAAASVVAGLAEAGSHVGARCVVVLYAASLGGSLSAGQLSGDDVIVITPGVPTAAAVSAAQAELLGAGAARAAVLGAEATQAQADQPGMPTRIVAVDDYPGQAAVRAVEDQFQAGHGNQPGFTGRSGRHALQHDLTGFALVRRSEATIRHGRDSSPGPALGHAHSPGNKARTARSRAATQLAWPAPSGAGEPSVQGISI